MGSIRVRARTIGLFLLSVHLSSAAAAGERISMPFDCRADGPRVELAPSSERSYAILGPHESEIFSACSPADPNRCRSWFVHRFDLDCNGSRVAWLDVAEAAMRYYDRPGWVEDGRFHVRMGPLWTFEGGRAFRDGQRRWMHEGYEPRGALGRFGDQEQRGYRDNPSVVTLPPGYAPARGIPVSFSGVADEAPPAATAMTAPSAAPVAHVVAPPEPAAIPELPQRAPRHEIKVAQAQAEAAAEAKAKAEPVAAASTEPEAPPAKLAMAEAAEPVVASTQADEPKDEAAAPSPPSPAPALTIINAPNAAAASTPSARDGDEQPAVAPPEEKAASADTGTISTGSTKAADTETVAAAESEPVADVPEVSAAAPPAPRNETIITPMTIAAAAALALAALAASMGFWRRSPDFVRVTPPAGRDYGSISLDGFRSAKPSLSVSLSPRSEPSPEPAGTAADTALAVAPDFPVPATYEQALDVLGASPDASLTAIKKIVDGLRQSWHPDHARSESDRLYRESRSRQINVAWDLVSQRRPAA